jgi:LysR family transcriptional regulator, glycine cleavage system transcriptional activator
MVRKFYDLPPVTSLAAFEAAARHCSFTHAANELNVTPGAVSRQIRGLEENLGAPLFLRNNRGVTLTVDGEALFHVLASGFSRAADTVRAIRKGETARRLTVACSDVFGSMWLVPRMPDFWHRYPEITVDHLITDYTPNFRRAEVELRIRFGSGTWADETSERLFDDRVYPVCSPGFAIRHGNGSFDALKDLPLLDVEWVATDWLRWEDMLAHVGVPIHSATVRRFGKFSVALQAAMADQGVVIGWHRIVEPLIREGKLMRYSDLVMQPPGGYYLTWNSDRTLSPAALTFREWMRELANGEQAADVPVPIAYAPLKLL